MEGLIFSHTTTIGIRRYPVERTVLNRRVEEMDLPLGKLAVKMCSFRGEERFYPEYESIARISSVPIPRPLYALKKGDGKGWRLGVDMPIVLHDPRPDRSNDLSVHLGHQAKSASWPPKPRT